VPSGTPHFVFPIRHYSTGLDPRGGSVGIFVWPGIVSGGSVCISGVYFDVDEEPAPVTGSVGGGGGSDGGGGAASESFCGTLSRCGIGVLSSGGMVFTVVIVDGPLTCRTGPGVAGVVKSAAPVPAGVRLDVLAGGAPAFCVPILPVAVCVLAGLKLLGSCARGSPFQPPVGLTELVEAVGVWLAAGCVVRLPVPRQHESDQQQPPSTVLAASKPASPNMRVVCMGTPFPHEL
jgi:hypothetical protein